jgi:hypothetical protein
MYLDENIDLEQLQQDCFYDNLLKVKIGYILILLDLLAYSNEKILYIDLEQRDLE